MEFNEKLQELRKKKGVTQEELAAALFISRTAVSKWESGRGYPSIESLRAIAKYYSVTVDELLSGEELLDIAREDGKRNEGRLRDLVFGLIDVSYAVMAFLPFFADRSGEVITEASLLTLGGVQTYLKVLYFVLIFGLSLFGVCLPQIKAKKFNFQPY